MPKAPQHILAWSEHFQRYELHTPGQPEQYFMRKVIPRRTYLLKILSFYLPECFKRRGEITRAITKTGEASLAVFSYTLR